MDTRQRHPTEGLGRLVRADWRITLAVGALVLGGVYTIATTLGHNAASPYANTALPAAAATGAPALSATPAATVTIAPTAMPTAVPTGTAAATATPTEAQTPLTLADPLASSPSAADAAPWWQSGLNVLWELGLVLAAIYLAMRGLAAFKQHGFGAPAARPADPAHPQFFAKLEELRLSPTYTLFAVRAGDRIILLAQNGATMTQLGDVELAAETPDAAAPTAFPVMPFDRSATPFDRQVQRAVAAMLPSTRRAPLAPDRTAPTAEDPPAAPAKGVIDAQWVTVEPDAAPAPSPKAAAPAPSPKAAAPAPRKGAARPSDRPAPPDQLDEAAERAILWYAEEHSISAAAEKYGLSRQRVTALRARYERDRASRRPDRDAPLPPVPAPLVPLPATPKRVAARPDHPRAGLAAEPPSLAAARAALARASYAAPEPPSPRPARPKRPDVVPADSAADDVASQATSVAQALAARFGIPLNP